MPIPALTLAIAAPRVAAGLTDRTVAGVALPYREVGRTSAGAVSVAAGALRIPADLRTVKLFSDHGRDTPVGYATAADDGADRLDMAFHVASTPAGDTALLEASEGVRDALSVELSDVTISGGVITSATLDAVALVPLPAYRSARLLLAADSDPATVTVTLPTADPADPDDDDDDTGGAADGDPDAEETPTMPAPTAPPAPPTPPADRRGGAAVATAGPAAVSAGVARLAGAIRGARDAAQVNAALSDIVPANDTGDAFLRPQWVDELWTPYYLEQFLSNAVTQAPLTGDKVVGWRWKVLPVVGDYAGNKTAIPSSPASLEPATADIYRIAGGWDIDRLFVDLGTGDFVGAVLNAAAIDAAAKMEAKVAAAVIAAARVVDTAAAGSAFDQVALLVADLVAHGAAATFVGLAPDVFADVLGVTSVDAPWWLGGGGSVNMASQTLGLPGGLSLGVSSGLAAGSIVAGDRRAFTHYQSPNIRVQALNIPNGGIDVGLFLYGADLVNNAAGLVQNTVPVIP